MTTAAPRSRRPRGRVLAVVLVAGVLAVVIGANIHLVWAAISSQPECVPHARTDDGDRFRAAKSAC